MRALTCEAFSLRLRIPSQPSRFNLTGPKSDTHMNAAEMLRVQCGQYAHYGALCLAALSSGALLSNKP